MRKPRMKLGPGAACYYHLFNRLSGPVDEYPLDDVDKERAFSVLDRLCGPQGYFLVEAISLTMMGNHFHLVAYVPDELPDEVVIARRHNAYFGERRQRLKPSQTGRCMTAGSQMTDISELMRAFQQQFAVYYNGAHRRRGRLWADRFKSVILEDGEALWCCVKYVELNAVRAKLAADPADYRFCSWGRYCGGGSHPYAAAFEKHLRHSRGPLAVAWTAEQVYAEFRSDLARTLSYEHQQQAAMRALALGLEPPAPESPAAAKARAMAPVPVPTQFLRRMRYWTQGAIIGSQAFVREVGGLFHAPERVARKRLGEVPATDNGQLFSFRYLRAARY